jgi:hypothetical protein
MNTLLLFLLEIPNYTTVGGHPDVTIQQLYWFLPLILKMWHQRDTTKVQWSTHYKGSYVLLQTYTEMRQNPYILGLIHVTDNKNKPNKQMKTTTNYRK